MSENNGRKVAMGAVRVGLIGSGIQASRSPAMHMDEAAALGLPLHYELFDLDRMGGAEALEGLLSRLESEGFAGVNITHPCKQSVLSHLDELSSEARLIGAVNTVVFTAGKRGGHNTDWVGFAESVRRGLPGASVTQVTQLGAGGAGCATVYALLSSGAGQVHIYDLAAARAHELCTRFTEHFGPGRVTAAHDTATALEHSDGLVNATPVGMRSYPGSPLPISLLRPSLWVADIVYFPLETELLQTARRAGCRTLDGGMMAVLQAAAAFRLFTGAEPDVERMLGRFAGFGPDAAPAR
ncbi:MAG: shikimate dehydrogenase [Proteobacteria bacterium]|nr:shikimate dehydrogenase [Pseudomonadota bacterium]